MRKTTFGKQFNGHAKDDPEYTENHKIAGPKADAAQVMSHMRENYPESALNWMKKVDWVGPVDVPHSKIDYDDRQSWDATHEPGKVNQFKRDIKNRKDHLDPVVMVKKPGRNRAEIVDGHHRDLAYEDLGRPAKAYVGHVPREKGPWDYTHDQQINKGSSPENK
jgi:hypothetical protein